MDPSVFDNLASIPAFQPELILIGVVIALFLFDVFRPGKDRQFYAAAAFVGLLITFIATLGQISVAAEPTALFNGMIVLDPFAVFFKLFFLLTAAITIVATLQTPELGETGSAEFYAFLMSTVLGMFLLASSNDILMLYLSLEMVSLTSYVMAGYRRGDRKSSEAALKYVVYGGAASGAMLYGLSILYGIAGTTALDGIRDAMLAAPEGMGSAALLGITFSLAGFGYKIASVPFHMWAPDVYEGAPIPVTAFFSVGPKAAGFAALTRFFFVAFVDPAGWGQGALEVVGAVPWPVIIGLVAAATMTLGNVAAVGQRDIKRLLAYSSIAHAGYMLLAFVAVSEQGLIGLGFYLVIYLLMYFGTWITAMAVAESEGSYDIEAWKGLGYRKPWPAVFMAIFLFSLTGLPPLAGFIGKFYIFYAVIAKGGFWLLTLGVIGVLNSVVSLYYYAYVVKKMFLEQPEDDAGEFKFPRLYAGLQAALVVPVVFLGVYWTPVYEFVASQIRLLV